MSVQLPQNFPRTACSRRLSVASGAESMSTQLVCPRVSLCYGTQHALVLDLEPIVMPPWASLAYDLLLRADFLSQIKGLCDMYDGEFAYCPRLHNHGDTRSMHRVPITSGVLGNKGHATFVADNGHSVRAAGVTMAVKPTAISKLPVIHVAQALDLRKEVCPQQQVICQAGPWRHDDGLQVKHKRMLSAIA
ncbi:hypothetical protein QJQ45_013144 [Haematococcus lacustris]|nr:hypothetical protein QJQ45_013144 [Haematococcus lacustris]